MRILNRSLPIFIRSSSLCCVARQTCRIIGNEKNNNTIFEKCGTSADLAGPRDIDLMKMRGTVPPNAGRLTPMRVIDSERSREKESERECERGEGETEGCSRGVRGHGPHGGREGGREGGR